MERMNEDFVATLTHASGIHPMVLWIFLLTPIEFGPTARGKAYRQTECFKSIAYGVARCIDCGCVFKRSFCAFYDL